MPTELVGGWGAAALEGSSEISTETTHACALCLSNSASGDLCQYIYTAAELPKGKALHPTLVAVVKDSTILQSG